MNKYIRPMDEYIERGKAIRAVLKQRRPTNSPAQNRHLSEIQRELLMLPAAAVAPVVHGEWLGRRGGFFDFATCSNCKEDYPLGGDTLNYCPNCGARMDGDSHADDD